MSTRAAGSPLTPPVRYDPAPPLVSVMKKGARFVPDGWLQLVPFEPTGWHSCAVERVSVKATNQHQSSSGPIYRPGYGQDGVNWS